MSRALIGRAVAAAAAGRPVAMVLALDAFALDGWRAGMRAATLDDGWDGASLPPDMQHVLTDHARRALDDDEPRRISFHAPTIAAFLVEPLRADRFWRAAAARLAEGPAALALDLSTGLRALVTPATIEGPLGLSPGALAAARALLAAGESRMAGPDLFVEVPA